MRSNQWELEEAQKALQGGEHKLCERYLEKALECIRCYICHEALTAAKPYRSHFKGYVHLDCARHRAESPDMESPQQPWDPC